MEHKRSARMTAIPQLDIPDILVDDEDDRAAAVSGAGDRSPQVASPSGGQAAFLSAHDAKPEHHRSWSGASMDISLQENSFAHPLSMPRASVASGIAGAATPTTPGGAHRYNTSAFSFEVQEPGEQGEQGGGRDSRRESGVSPAQVRELLDDSAWMASIRRSATQRRSQWGN